jgi:hypothetical protein
MAISLNLLRPECGRFIDFEISFVQLNDSLASRQGFTLDVSSDASD